jgi:hypothetical protein
MRRSELSTPRAIWVLLLAHLGRPPRQRIRLPAEERVRPVNWVFSLILVVCGGTLGLTVWGYQHGWGYQAHPWHNYMVLPMVTMAVLAGLALVPVVLLVVVATRRNRAKRRTWPETKALRQRDRIHHLEAELDMREYDEISAITRLGRELAPPSQEAYSVDARATAEWAAMQRYAMRWEMTVAEPMGPKVKLSPTERALLVHDYQGLLMRHDHVAAWVQGCRCAICEVILRNVEWTEGKRQARPET